MKKSHFTSRRSDAQALELVRVNKNENLADTFVKARESCEKSDLKVEDFEPFQRTV